MQGVIEALFWLNACVERGTLHADDNVLITEDSLHVKELIDENFITRENSACHMWKVTKNKEYDSMGIQLGRSQPRAELVGKTFPRPNVTLSDFLPAECERNKGNRSRNSSPAMSRRSRNVSPAMSRKKSVVSWSDSPREQSEANGEDAVMEDGAETHQEEINKKIKPNDKLRKNSNEHARGTQGAYLR